MSKYKYYNKDWNWSAGPPLCAFFLRRGKCKYEDECKFSHDKATGDKNKVPLCKFWLEGECKFGDNCTFRHATEDIDAMTARYNAQIINQASLGMKYVWHPDFGMTLAKGAALPQAPSTSSLPSPYKVQYTAAPPQQSSSHIMPSYPATSFTSMTQWPSPYVHQYPLAQVSTAPVLGALPQILPAQTILSAIAAPLAIPLKPKLENLPKSEDGSTDKLRKKREREGSSELNNPPKRTKLVTLTLS